MDTSLVSACVCRPRFDIALILEMPSYLQVFFTHSVFKRLNLHTMRRRFNFSSIDSASYSLPDVLA
jgi:hypothetical protein